ncbi:MAG: hypothetical protein EON98_16300, partial [Chitinophagaceae bacterium]
MKYNQLLLLALLLLSSSLFAQTIQLRSGTFQPANNIRQEVIDSFNRSVDRVDGQAFSVIQFKTIPSAEEQKALLANGITLLDYIADNTYAVSIKGALSTEALKAVNTRSLFQLSPRQKMQDYLANGILPAWAVKQPGT